MLEGGVWRTISGRRVFIKTGQSLTDAMKESGKFKLQKGTKLDKLSEKELDEEARKKRKEIREMYDKLRNDKISEEESDKLFGEIEKKKKERDELQYQLDRRRNMPTNIKTIEIPKNYDEIIAKSIDEELDRYDYGRFDIDKNSEELYTNIYYDLKKKLNRDLIEDDYEMIEEKLSDRYKDGFYVSTRGHSAYEYMNKVNDMLDEVGYKLEDKGFDVVKSRSQFAGLVSSRYYTKDGITIRIGDHKNSNGWSATHTEDELYNSTVDDLVKYVENEYKRRKK